MSSTTPVDPNQSEKKSAGVPPTSSTASNSSSLRRPRVAVYKFASCDGCQLSLLSVEDQLLALAQRIEIAYFLEATSSIQPGPYDIGIVEGSVTTEEDAHRIRRIRQDCRYLITIGACATAGGIQALRNWGEVDQFVRQVYAHPSYISTLKNSTPIAANVPVDFELRGCPIDADQLLKVIGDLLAGRRPSVPRHSVCIECKLRETVCVAVARGIPCLGPVTHGGCGAICPAFDRECFGCFGPKPEPNLISLTNHYRACGHPPRQLVQLVRNINGYAPEFQEIGDQLSNAAASSND
jgi:sulfhydrogenase subunit delta